MFINWINKAKREETKVKRVVQTLNKLANNEKFGDPGLRI